MRGFGNGEVEAQIRLRGQFGIVAVVHLYQRVKGIAQPLFIRLGGALRGVPVLASIAWRASRISQR